MAITNPWQNVFQRSYQQIKNGLIQNMRIRLPEVTDQSEGNIFIILISMFAAIAEVIHYYLDNMARETFFITARRYSSLIKHAKLVDYHIKAAIPASADLLVTIANNRLSEADYNIPIGTIFTGQNSLQYKSVRNVTFYAGTYGVYVPVEQKVTSAKRNMGIISGDSPLIYIDEENGFYAEGSAVMEINNILWTLVDTFGYSSSTSLHYKVELDSQQRPYIMFGDGIFGARPPLNGVVTLQYEITAGVNGNTNPDTIITVTDQLDIPNVEITNPNGASGGSNYENFNMLKEHVPLSIRTLGVAISKQDYEDVTKLAPGVDKAFVDFKCGKFIDIYIIPDGGGIASEALLESTYRYVSVKKIVTSNIRILPTGSSFIYIDMTVRGVPSIRATIINDAVQRVLIDRYNYNNSEIGRIVYLSDVYALVDNLEVVDNLTINHIYTIPYPRPEVDVRSQLNIVRFSVNYIRDVIVYTITYVGDGINEFEVSNDIGEIQYVSTNFPVTLVSGDDTARFEIVLGPPLAGNYEAGDRWTLTLNPSDGDQVIADYSIPRMTIDTLSINVIETV